MTDGLQGLLGFVRKLASLHLQQGCTVQSIHTILNLVFLFVQALAPKLHNIRQRLIIGSTVEGLLGVGKKFLMTVVHQQQGILNHLHMSALLHAFILHHADKARIPVALVSYLLLGVLELWQIFVADAICIQSVSTDNILHLEHIYNVGRDILFPKFLGYNHNLPISVKITKIPDMHITKAPKRRLNILIVSI